MGLHGLSAHSGGMQLGSNRSNIQGEDSNPVTTILMKTTLPNGLLPMLQVNSYAAPSSAIRAQPADPPSFPSCRRRDTQQICVFSCYITLQTSPCRSFQLFISFWHRMIALFLFYYDARLQGIVCNIAPSKIHLQTMCWILSH